MRTVPALVGAGAAAGAYALVESRRYHLEERRVPVADHIPRVSILHISDTHLRASHRRLIRFLAALPDRIGALPDLVLATGDLIEDDGGIEPLVEALGRLEAKVGRYYVLGSHDLYRSTISGALGSWRMFAGRERKRSTARRNDHHRLEAGLREKGWKSLLNSVDVVDVPSGRVRLAGVHDPYLGLHTTSHLRREAGDALAVGLVHSPDVVSEWVLSGFDLVVAGHTHAGQVRLPWVGSVVTNCSLPNALSGGLHRVGNAWLHVSPGLGTSRFAPVRFLARPAATLLHLDPEVA
jgi:uncharacterized protein